MFLKYFFILVKKFGTGFKKQMTVLLFMSVIGGFLELLGIAMIFPVMIVLTSEKESGGQFILDFFTKIFPRCSTMKIALILAILMIGVFLFKNIFMIIYVRLQNEFVRKWTDSINNDVAKKLLYAPYRLAEKISWGDKNTLLFSAVRDISLDFSLRTIILIANAVVALFIVALLFYKFTVPAFLSTVFILIFAYFENIFFKQKAKRLGDVGVELLNEFALNVNSIIQSQKEIAILNKQEFFTNYLMKSSRGISKNFSDRISYGNYPLYVTEIGVILSFLIMIVAIFVSDGSSKGVIISSLAVIALITLRLVPQLNKVLISMYTINAVKQKVIWFLEKYDEISKMGSEKYKDLPKIDFREEIELKNISFAYDTKNGIKNINLKIKKGEFIGIIGASGAGKTTLANIISGIYFKDSGTFKVDNIEITPQNITSWQKNISYLPQEAYLLNDSILNNVAFGDESPNINKVKESLNKAGLLIENINKKADLSRGQKQRVALARAYYKDFEVLILDEATSCLDVETEKLVMENIVQLKGEKTLIAIAHRLSTLKKCDRIIYLDNGGIKDIGTFEELRERHDEIDKLLRTYSFE